MPFVVPFSQLFYFIINIIIKENEKGAEIRKLQTLKKKKKEKKKEEEIRK